MTPLYYLPGVNAAKDDTIERFGLGYAFEGDSVPHRAINGGPDGGNGIIIAAGDKTRIGYFPDRQRWRQIPKSDAWIGIDTEQPPKPHELIRDDRLSGHFVRLADGHDWLVPVACLVVEENGELVPANALPYASDLDEQGDWVPSGVHPTYAPLWKIACDWWEAWSDAEVSEENGTTRMRFDFAGLRDAAVRVLGVNYRVANIEAAMLGILDDHVARNVLEALVDAPSIKAFVKKKAASVASASCSTSCGDPDET